MQDKNRHGVGVIIKHFGETWKRAVAEERALLPTTIQFNLDSLEREAVSLLYRLPYIHVIAVHRPTAQCTRRVRSRHATRGRAFSRGKSACSARRAFSRNPDGSVGDGGNNGRLTEEKLTASRRLPLIG